MSNPCFHYDKKVKNSESNNSDKSLMIAVFHEEVSDFFLENILFKIN
jgi:hypothetical protein